MQFYWVGLKFDFNKLILLFMIIMPTYLILYDLKVLDETSIKVNSLYKFNLFK